MIRYYRPFLFLLGFYVIVCTLLRILLIWENNLTLTIIEYIKVFSIGWFRNISFFLCASFFLWLYLILLTDVKFQKPIDIILATFFLLLLGYLLLFNNIFKQYGSIVLQLIVGFVGFKALCFGLMWWQPKLRHPIRLGLYFFTLYLYVSLIMLNTLSEYFFWKEFGVRYNFIAVDYLIYTNEVIGNILESYPVIPMFTVLGVVSLIIVWAIYKHSKEYILKLPTVRQKLKLSILYFVVTIITTGFVNAINISDRSSNLYAKELEADGPRSFYEAFLKSNLSYQKFYLTISKNDAIRNLSAQLPGLNNSSDNYVRSVVSGNPLVKKNIVLISVESLSADFMKHFGNTQGITPFLDSLADQSLLFTNLFAAGNRTVRGLEAVTLCMPPTPGESIIKQKQNKNLFSVASVLKQQGYSANFFYGGYSYFDNMKDFFSGNGYRVIDRSNLNPSEISFANIWGACDEDMAKKCIKEINEMVKTGQPFYAHWLTVSNHRPFTYPDGKIDIPSNSKSREGGVKYTDYALGRFIKMATGQSWFNNTVFVIVADHCASSAGKVALPVEKYHIPALIYSPGFVKAGKVNTLMSQIDLMPTVFDLLGFSYRSSFMGTTVFDTSFVPRTFMATYQSLGFLKDSVLTVLSPVRQLQQYYIKPKFSKEKNGMEFDEVPVKKINMNLRDQAISYYQLAGGERN